MNKSYIVSGLVQGVGFRYAVLKYTKRHYPDLKGFVKNLPDGTVEIYLEGDDAEISAYISDIKDLDFYGYIKDIKDSNRFISGHYNDFVIEY